MSIKNTQTEKNLLKSFAGESQARNRYTYYSKIAETEGFIEISLMFLEIADQERVHAKNFFKKLEGGSVEITTSYPAGTISTTIENLKAAIAGEHEEHSELYPEFSRVASAEGFEEIARLYKNVSVAEKHHESRFKKALDLLEKGTYFVSERECTWECMKCGYTASLNHAPEKCAACNHPKGWFKRI